MLTRILIFLLTKLTLFTHLAPSLCGLPNLVAGHVAQLHIAAHLLDAELPLQDGDHEIFHHKGN